MGMTRLDHVKGMINNIGKLSKELYIEFDQPRYVFHAYSMRPRTRFDVRPRSKKAADAYYAKHKRLKNLIKELYIKHGDFMKDNKLPTPDFGGRLTVLK